jgi:uncharacterized protein (DUF58 family)
MKKKSVFRLALIIPAFAGLVAFSPSTIPSQDNILTVDVKKGIIVEKEEHDFGTISQDGGNVSATFTIYNGTNEAITLVDVIASCGCTKPKWTSEPIEPGKRGEVVATYTPKGRPGPFNKTITATTQTGEKLIMRIKGVVE